MTNKQAAYRQRLKEAGGRMVRVRLSAEDGAILDQLRVTYGSGEQAMRVALRALAPKA